MTETYFNFFYTNKQRACEKYLQVWSVKSQKCLYNSITNKQQQQQQK